MAGLSLGKNKKKINLGKQINKEMVLLYEPPSQCKLDLPHGHIDKIDYTGWCPNLNCTCVHLYFEITSFLHVYICYFQFMII